MVSVKGTASKLEKEILDGIIEPNCPNIEFKNITFDCKSIKDAAGHIFINQTYCNESNKKEAKDDKSYWILCKERLPKYRETVIATNRWHDGVDIVFRDAIQEDGTDDRWVFPLDDDAYCAIEDFIAWMPLPKPYMGKKKDDETDIANED